MRKIAIVQYLSICFLLLAGLHADATGHDKDKFDLERGKVKGVSGSKASTYLWSADMLSNAVVPETPLVQSDILLLDSARRAFEQITRNGSWVNLLTDNASVKFPFGMLKKNANYSTVYQLAFNNVSITKSGAVARVFGRVLLNGSQNSALYFQGFVNLSRIGGAGSSNKLTLIGDQTVNNSEDWSLILNGGESLSPTTMNFNCDGFSSLDINGSINLNKDKYKPVAVNGSAANEEQLKSKIAKTGLEKWEELYEVKLKFDSYFTVPAIPLIQGYTFRISSATLDMHDNKSPSGGDIGNYISKEAVRPGLWRGLAIDKMEVGLPGYFYTGKKVPPVLAANYGVIDENGFSFSFQASNVFDHKTGSANGWDMSVTKLNLTVLKGVFGGGSFSGNLALPIEGNDLNWLNVTGIPYETVINDDGSIETEQVGDDIPYIAIQPLAGYIHPESISISMDIDLKRNKILPKVTISGVYDFSMSGDDVPYIPTKKQDERDRKSNFAANAIEIQDMVLQTEGEYMSIGSVGTSRQMALAGFAADIAVEYRKEAPHNALDASTSDYRCLHFDANLQFGGGKVSGGAAFDLYMKYDTALKKWKYATYAISKVKVGYEGGKVKFNGEINYLKDKTYGRGFGGTVKLTVLGKVEMGASILFGQVTSPTGQMYDYYNVDAMAKSIRYPINPYLTITGFSGGLTWRMDPVTPDGVMPVSLSGISYKPNDESFLRVRAGIYFEVNNERLMTGWGGLEIVFNRNFGVNEVSLSGRAQIFSKPDAVIKKPDINPVKNGDVKGSTASKGGGKSASKKKQVDEDDEEDKDDDGGVPLSDKLAIYSGGKGDAAEGVKGAIIGAEEVPNAEAKTKIESLFPPDKYDLPIKFDSSTLTKLKARYVINRPIYDRTMAVLDSFTWIGVNVFKTYNRLKESTTKWDTRYDTHPYVQFYKSHEAYSKLLDDATKWREVCKRVKLPYLITPLSPDNSFIYESNYVLPTPKEVEMAAAVAPRDLVPLILFKAANSNEYGVITVAKLLVPYYNDVFNYNSKRRDSASTYEKLYNYYVNEVGLPPSERTSGERVHALGIQKGNTAMRDAWIAASRLAGRTYANVRGGNNVTIDTAAVVGGTLMRDSLYTYEGMVAVNTVVYELAAKARAARIKRDGGISLSKNEMISIAESDAMNEQYAPFLKEASRIKAVKQQKSLYDDVVSRARMKGQLNAIAIQAIRKEIQSKLDILESKLIQEGQMLSKGELLFTPTKEQMGYLEKNYAKNKHSDTLGGLQILRKPTEMSGQIAIDMVIYDDLKKGASFDEKSAFREMETRRVHVGVAMALLEIANDQLRSAAEAAEEKNANATSGKMDGAVLPAYAKPDGDPIVWGDFTAKMDIANNTFSFVLQAYIIVEESGQSVLEGSGPNFRAGVAELYVSGSTFKINVGTQEDPCGVVFRPAGLSAVNADASFYLQATNAKGDDGADFSLKAGLAVNVALGGKASLVGFGVYAYLNGKVSVDFALKRFDNLICNGKPISAMNGWYGKGQFYGSIKGAIGVIVGGNNIELFSGGIGLTCMIMGPVPFYVEGKVRLDVSFMGMSANMELPLYGGGEKCANIKF